MTRSGDGEPRHDPAERIRSAEVEVPGTPEEVWEAIATGSGHAAWLFAAEIEPGEGGAMMIHRRPYGDDVNAVVTAWEPPHRFGFQEPVGPEAKPLATEFLVQAERGGTCVVRVVSGFYGEDEGWEDLVDGAAEGWRMSLTVLRAYLTHFAGRRARNVDVLVDLGLPAADRSRAFAVVSEQLGLHGLEVGDRFRTRPGAPPLSGAIEHTSAGYVLLRADEPHPALYAISCFPMADGAPLSANLMARLYGVPAEIAEQEQDRWRSWLVETRRSIR